MGLRQRKLSSSWTTETTRFRSRTERRRPFGRTRVGPAPYPEPRRLGTTAPFAAREVFGGTVIERNRQGPRHREFIRFLNLIEAATSADNLVHAMLNSDVAHRRLLRCRRPNHHSFNDGHDVNRNKRCKAGIKIENYKLIMRQIRAVAARLCISPQN